MQKKSTKLRHILSTSQLRKQFLLELFAAVDIYVQQLGYGLRVPNPQVSAGLYRDYLLYTLLDSPSPRSQTSLLTAAKRMGISIVDVNSNGDESLTDMLKSLSEYKPHIIAVNQPPGKELELSAHYSSAAMINIYDDPLQTLVDLYTIYREAGRLQNLRVVIGGDLRRNLPARNLALALCLFENISFIFVSPENARIDDELRENMYLSDIEFKETTNLDSMVLDTDVFYWVGAGESEYFIDERVMRMLSPNAILMHPLPRSNDLLPEVDNDRRAKHFAQSGYSVPILMALIEYLLEGHNLLRTPNVTPIPDSRWKHFFGRNGDL